MSGGDPVCVIENDRASLSTELLIPACDSCRSLAVGGSVMRNNPLFVVHTYTHSREGGGAGRRKARGTERDGRGERNSQVESGRPPLPARPKTHRLKAHNMQTML